MSVDAVISAARRMCATHREPDLIKVRNELRVALAAYDEQKYPTRGKPMVVSRTQIFFICDADSPFGPCRNPDLCTKNRLCGESFAT